MQYKSYLIEQNIGNLKENLILFYGENIGLIDDFKSSIKKFYKDQFEIINFTQEDILKNIPNHPDANHNFGLLCSKLGEPAMGVQFLRTAIETNPTVAGYWISIIDTLIEVKDVENAKIALEKAKEVGHNGEVFEKLEANIDILRNSKKESEAV